MIVKEKGSGLYPISTKLEELDDLAMQLPNIFGAYVDHRLKKDTWIWVKPLYQIEAFEYMKNVLGVACVPLETSEEWYEHI